MQKLRIAVFFIFAALSMARADCVDFTIFANGTSLGNNSSVSYSIVIGEDLEFTVDPEGESIVWWRVVNDTDVAVSDKSSFSPPTSMEALGGNTAQTINYKVLNCGIEKTISLALQSKTYTVTYNSAGGSNVPQQTGILHGASTTKPSPDPTRPGYTFAQWELPIGTAYNFSTPVTDDITLTAKWNINQYTVSFNSGDGSAVNPQTVNYGSTAAKPPDPTRPGYTFAQWELNGTAYDFSAPVTGNITLTAKWNAKTYTVTFNSNNGSAINPITVDFNTAAVKPSPDPTRPGYTFAQWELNGTAYNFSTPVIGNITLTAKWDLINYTITYHPNGGTPAPPDGTYNVESVINLPSIERCGYTFAGWFDNPDFSPNGSSLGNKDLYAKWVGGLMTPDADLLSYSIPNLTYTGQAISPAAITVSPKPENQCPLGSITVLYNGTNTLPKDAGTYAISASIAENSSYTAAIVPLGNLTISKADISISIISATAENKIYDAATTAKVNFSFSPLLGNDQISANDYSVVANFASPNAGTSIPVTGTIAWLINKNYNISPSSLPFASTADITLATGILQIEQPDYELSDPKPYIINKSPFIELSDIHIEYRRDEGYSTNAPRRVGNWTVKAWFESTGNYTGAIDSATFTVTRGDADIIHNIAFEKSGFKNDAALNGKRRDYFVAGTELCNIKDTKIKITIVEPDIVFSLGKGRNNPQRPELDENGFDFYEFDFSFGKPGLDTLFYTLLSKDGIYWEDDTVLIETPIPFESITGQKWGNVLFINNNSQTNGGYEFSDYKWFQNEELVSETQFYSAGPSSADTLKSNDVYKVTMHTTDGMRISTCEGSPKIQTPANAEKPAFTKQVLGINGRTTKSNAKIYNIKGSKTENTPAGVYIVEK